MENQKMTPTPAEAEAEAVEAMNSSNNYLFTLQTPQIHPDMDWATLFLSDPEQAPPYETPNTSMTTTTMISNDHNNISNCLDHEADKQLIVEEEEKEEDRHKEKRRASRVSRRKAGPPRVEFQTKSSEDLLDDGYRWRKYGQKSVKNSLYPRSYYRCTHHTCNVKKQVQRLSKDTSIVVTTYEGIHNHPCEQIMETLSPLLRQMQFLARF